MDYIIIAVVGSLIILDTTVAFQLLISQPLITSTITGYILGDVELGLKIGFYLQLLWLSCIPVGAAIVPEGNAAAIIITSLIIKHSSQFENFYTILVCTTIYGILISYIGGQLVVMFRKANIVLMQKVSYNIQKGNFNYLNRINIIALIFHFILFFILIILSLYLGNICFKIFELIPIRMESFFQYGAIAIIAIGIGLILPIYREKYAQNIIFVGLLIGLILFIFIK
jgi:mannose/fructose/N-acetylgalactosamine-specific phosphotransferase system component IIC